MNIDALYFHSPTRYLEIFRQILVRALLSTPVDSIYAMLYETEAAIFRSLLLL